MLRWAKPYLTILTILPGPNNFLFLRLQPQPDCKISLHWYFDVAESQPISEDTSIFTYTWKFSWGACNGRVLILKTFRNKAANALNFFIGQNSEKWHMVSEKLYLRTIMFLQQLHKIKTIVLPYGLFSKCWNWGENCISKFFQNGAIKWLI